MHFLITFDWVGSFYLLHFCVHILHCRWVIFFLYTFELYFSVHINIPFSGNVCITGDNRLEIVLLCTGGKKSMVTCLFFYVFYWFVILSMLSGYYCPENSSSATPCPVGSYNPNEEAGSAGDCLLCKVDHYNPFLAQTQCFHCGAEAEQPSKGQSTCECRGAGRDFQVRDENVFFQKNNTPPNLFNSLSSRLSWISLWISPQPLQVFKRAC